jgi:hypothetical protein
VPTTKSQVLAVIGRSVRLPNVCFGGQSRHGFAIRNYQIAMSAFGPKQNGLLRCTCPLSGVKRTSLRNQTTTADGFSGILKVDLSEIASKFVLQEGPACLPHELMASSQLKRCIRMAALRTATNGQGPSSPRRAASSSVTIT